MKPKFYLQITFWINSLLILLVSSINLQAGVIQGKIVDAVSHEPVVGAVITVEDHKNHVTVSDLYGNYRIENLQVGKFVIHAKSLGFENSYTQELEITSFDQTITFDIYIKPVNTQINEVQITGKTSLESDAGARESEKVASNVVNIISAKAIEMLPDLNVANVMQRVSGISMVKNSSGNNSQVIIRGMPPRYNTTLINGISIPGTSESKSSVSLDIFPSVFVGRVEVIKAPTPDNEGDAIGGIVNIEMKNAPDTAVLLLDVATGTNEMLLENGFYTFDYHVVNDKNPAQIHGPYYQTSPSDFPTANLVLNHIQAPPDFLGTLSYGNRFLNKKLGLLISGTYQNTYQEVINDYYSTEDSSSTIKLTSKNMAKLCNQINRIGVVAKLDYHINTKNQISIYNNFFSLDEIRTRNERDTSYEINWGRVYYYQYTNLDKSNLENLVLQGKHQISDHLNLDWSMVYSAGNSVSPDLVTVATTRSIHPTIEPLYLSYSDAVDRQWQWNSNSQKSAYINIDYKTLLFNHFFEFKTGGMAIDKYSLNNENDYARPFLFTIKYPNPNVISIYSHNLLDTMPTQIRLGDALYNPANFRAFGDIFAGFALFKTNFGKLNILGGVRIEKTIMSQSHRELLSGQDTTTHGSQSYIDILPSIHFNYTLDQEQNLRLSFYTAINRPTIEEVVPYTSVSVNGSTSGNPNLQHAYGYSFDARYEIYPSGEEVITGGVFYKYLKNPIEEYVNGNGDSYPANIKNCSNYGFELVAIKYIRNFGINVNYTYTYSNIADPKIWLLPLADNGRGKDTTLIQNRPLAGQSKHLINAALIYRDNKSGFKCQLTYTMQGKNLVERDPNYGLDSYQLNYNDLGLSLDKRLTSKLHIYAKASNLLNEGLQFQTENGINTRELTSKRSFIIGLKLNI